MVGSTINGKVTTTVTLGSASYPSPVTVTGSGDIVVSAYGAIGVYGSPGSGVLVNAGAITGGAGSTTNGSVDSNGGAGVYLLGGDTAINNGAITGGAGGGVGRGGAGVSLDGGTLSNSGSITGGYSPGSSDYAGSGVLLLAGTLINTGIIAGGGARGVATPPVGAGGNGVYLAATATLFNDGTIAGGSDGEGGLIGIFIAADGTLANAGLVTGGGGDFGGLGIDLSNGGSLDNSGIIVGGSGDDGIGVFAQDGMITNVATIIGGAGVNSIFSGSNVPGGSGVSLAGGGILLNTAFISGGDAAASAAATGGDGLDASDGGTFTNTADATITGGSGNGFNGTNGAGGGGGAGASLISGTLTNAGSITGGSGVGSVPSQAGGNGGTGVSLTAGAVVNNTGRIGGGLAGYDYFGDSGGSGVLMAPSSTGGTLVNSGLVTGGNGDDVVPSGANALRLGHFTVAGGAGAYVGSGNSLINTGTIVGGVGVYVGAGGAFTSGVLSTISGGDGVAMAVSGTLTNTGSIISGVGVYLAVGGTLIDGGTISGGVYGGVTADAVLFAGAGTLVVKPGVAFVGAVVGDASANDALYLGTYYSTPGTLTDLGTQFVGFGRVNVDAGASWFLTGASTIAPGVTLADNGTLTVTGKFANSGGISGANGAVGGPGLITGQGRGIYLSAATLSNSGTIVGGGGGGGQSGGEDLNNIAGQSGGAALTGSGSTLTNFSLIQGGNGGGGGANVYLGPFATATYFFGGVGGSGGAGVALSNTSLNNSGTIIGGYGGGGGDGELAPDDNEGGSGGTGGVGAALLLGSTLTNSGSIVGGGGGRAGGGGTLGEDGGNTANNIGGLGADGVYVGHGSVLINTGGINGGFGGTSGVGRPGGNGGQGAFVANGTLDNSGTISGGMGSSGLGNPSTVGPVGTGGVGVYVESGTASNSGAILGAHGLNAFFTALNGGDGAVGILLNGAFSNSGTVAGGGGGYGQYNRNSAGGSGGAGGVGAFVAGGSLANTGIIAGGDGGAGGISHNNDGGSGSAGGVGAYVATGTLTNSGTIAGGSGGVGGSGSSNGATGAGGVGVFVHGAGTISNAGLIQGTGGSDAVLFTSGYAGRVIIDPTAVFAGTVNGGNSLGGPATSTLELASDASVGTLTGLGTQFINFGSIAFDPGAAWSITGNTSGLAGTITGFAQDDTIEISGITVTGTSYANGVLTLTDATGDATLDLQGNFATSDFLVTNVAGGADISLGPICYLAGTRIATPDGETTVERLAPDDMVMTLNGKARRVVWIGNGRVLATRGRRNAATPVIVRKSALGINVPHSDLRITKAHALYIDSVLVPVEFLVNHRTILWDDHAQEVTVYHIELETHDVLLANGAPAESYRDDGNRWLFQNANSGWGLPMREACAPILTGGPIVDAIWQRLLDRAGKLRSLPLTDDPDLHLLVDGRRLEAVERTGDVYVFRLPLVPSILRIVSRASTPAELGLARDPRVLGVALRRLALRKMTRFRIIKANDKRLREGFHAFESDSSLRWTNGDAAIPVELCVGFTGSFELVLDVGATTHYVEDGLVQRFA
jgi:hypothetical protein